VSAGMVTLATIPPYVPFMFEVITMRILLAVVVLSMVVFGSLCGDTQAIGQNVYQDYWVNRTGSYSPQDPWQKGHIFRTHTGHDGLFYNCDGEEEKRCSPWIRWGQRPCDDLLSPARIRGEYKQSLCDALERLKLGSCQDTCGVAPGMGYPPGAGYGNEFTGSSLHQQPPTSILDSAPGDLGVTQPADPHTAPPEPQPSAESRQRSRGQQTTSIVDLPSINHLRRTPR